uniref:Uncharacterized protein n=1 Tax=Asparagus officinalis TaxID=4686 RepID=Q2XNU8_ASPOF|nr:hypothetical protein 12.t00041 [Asparagus officinalis]
MLIEERIFRGKDTCEEGESSGELIDGALVSKWEIVSLSVRLTRSFRSGRSTGVVAAVDRYRAQDPVGFRRSDRSTDLGKAVDRDADSLFPILSRNPVLLGAKPTGIVRAKCYAVQSATSRGRESPLEAVGATSRISHGCIDRFDWNTHTTKMHLLFGNQTLRNSKVKRAWPGEILGWVTP